LDVASFDDIAADFNERVSRIVWATVTSVDRQGRPRSRLLHPIWDGATGYIMTGPTSHKAKHLAANPYVSVSYWDPKHDTVFAECKSEWVADPAEKQRVWDLFKNTPEPYGYNPAMFWPDGPASPAFGVMKLTPWRIELYSLADLAQRKMARVWRAG
jgi:general stress protein 26